jgi:hypothetical protein
VYRNSFFLREFPWTSDAKKKTLSSSGLLKFAFHKSSVIPILVRYKGLDIITLLHFPSPGFDQVVFV